MKSSRHCPEQPELMRPAVLFADGGVSVPVSSNRDPFEALDDLMAVLDVLCPQWPPRKSFGPMPDLRL